MPRAHLRAIETSHARAAAIGGCAAKKPRLVADLYIVTSLGV
jgi:hypothetical protein